MKSDHVHVILDIFRGFVFDIISHFLGVPALYGSVVINVVVLELVLDVLAREVGLNEVRAHVDV